MHMRNHDDVVFDRKPLETASACYQDYMARR